MAGDKTIYKITFTDTATYYICSDSQEDAIELAGQWFSERTPEPDVEICEDQDFSNIQKLMGAYYEI